MSQTDEQQLVIARQVIARYHITMSVLAQGDSSPHMTDEFKQKLVEAKEKLAPYTIAARAVKSK
ncbi:hypothetical protein [Mesorhizobium sp. A556]